MLRQKFRMFTLVHIAKDLVDFSPDCGVDAIVGGTYSQLYGGNDIKNYQLYILKNGKVVNLVAWYDEECLTKLPWQNKDWAEEALEDYHMKEEK